MLSYYFQSLTTVRSWFSWLTLPVWKIAPWFILSQKKVSVCLQSVTHMNHSWTCLQLFVHSSIYYQGIHEFQCQDTLQSHFRDISTNEYTRKLCTEVLNYYHNQFFFQHHSLWLEKSTMVLPVIRDITMFLMRYSITRSLFSTKQCSAKGCTLGLLTSCWDSSQQHPRILHPGSSMPTNPAESGLFVVYRIHLIPVKHIRGTLSRN